MTDSFFLKFSYVRCKLLYQEGLDRLKNEIKELESIERPKISQQIAEARDKGDLSENAEYDAAKEAQGLLEARIAKLKNKLANARLIDDSDIDSSKVFILSTVKIKNIQNKMEVSYTIVAENEADLKARKFQLTHQLVRDYWVNQLVI